MLDWIMHIWQKPLAAWTLLDVFGLFLILNVCWILPASCAATISESTSLSADKRAKRLRAKLGYGADDEKR
jgi:hypothetical protein